MNRATPFVEGFNQQGVYPCPACRVGQIQALSLMDAMACDACQHIFTTNLEKQWLLMIDRTPPVIWHWTGKHWIGAHAEGVQLGWGFWLGAIAFVLLPPTVIGVSAYVVTTAPGASPPLFSIAWIGLTFLLHLALVVRSVIGFYRLSIGTFFSVMRRKLLNRESFEHN